MKFAGTPANKERTGLDSPYNIKIYDPKKVPIAAPNPATHGPPNIAKSAGNIIPHLNWPTPHGVGMNEVVAMDKVYKPAQIDIMDIFNEVLMLDCIIKPFKSPFLFIV